MVKKTLKMSFFENKKKKSRIVGQGLEKKKIKISENQFICLNLIYFNIFYYILIHFYIKSIKIN